MSPLILFAIVRASPGVDGQTLRRVAGASIGSATRRPNWLHERRQTNSDLLHQNTLLARQRDLIEQEEALAQHVFRQLIIGGDHRLPGIHTWNQSMGTLSGDLTQTARGPAGQAYVFLGDFTGHGLPAALGALPASSVFLAMAARAFPSMSIAREAQQQIAPAVAGRLFCCAVLVELSADRRSLHAWNGGLPPVLIKRRRPARLREDRIPQPAAGRGGNDEFEATAQRRHLHPATCCTPTPTASPRPRTSTARCGEPSAWRHSCCGDDIAHAATAFTDRRVLEHVNLAPHRDDIRWRSRSRRRR